MELDFTKLRNISYRGIDDEEARAQKDKLIEQGFTIVEGIETPFTAAVELSAKKATPPPANASQGNFKPFTGIDTSRNYRAMYRAVCNLHERFNPPLVEGLYWQDHTPGIDETPQTELDYWADVAKAVGETAADFQQDPFITGMLIAVVEELEREYRAKKESCLS